MVCHWEGSGRKAILECLGPTKPMNRNNGNWYVMARCPIQTSQTLSIRAKPRLSFRWSASVKGRPIILTVFNLKVFIFIPESAELINPLLKLSSMVCTVQVSPGEYTDPKRHFPTRSWWIYICLVPWGTWGEKGKDQLLSSRCPPTGLTALHLERPHLRTTYRWVSFQVKGPQWNFWLV